VTGEKADLYFGSPEVDGSGVSETAAKSADMAAGGASLTPAERAAIEDMAKYMKVGRAEELARALPYVGLDSSYKLKSSNLQKNWNTEGYLWSLTFVKFTGSGEVRREQFIYVGLDAEDGQLMNFNGAYNYELKAPAKLPELSAVRSEAEQALHLRHHRYRTPFPAEVSPFSPDGL
jgi:hypothetical protein